MVVSNPRTHPVSRFKTDVQASVRLAYRGAPLTGALSVRALLLLPRPGYLCRKKGPQPRVWHHVRPDLDNYEKALLDACNGILWNDDGQIAEKITRKMFAAAGEATGVLLKVVELSDGKDGR